MQDQLVHLWQQEPEIRVAALVIASALGAWLVEVMVCRTLVALVGKTQTTVDDLIVSAIRRPLFVSVLLVGLAYSARELPLRASVRNGVEAIMLTLCVLAWTGAAFRIGHAVLELLSRRGDPRSLVQPRTLPVFEMLLKIAIIGAAVYAAFLVWKIDLTAWLASAGILGIAIGFAAKDTLANLFSGIFIVADAPYKVGDFIVLDNELRGLVTKIGIRSTRVLTRDDVEITIPNAIIGGSKIINETGGPMPRQRVRVAVDVAYGSNIDQVRDVLLSCPKGCPDVAADRTPEVRFRQFGGSGLSFELLVWIDDPATRGLVIDRLNELIYKSFAAAGIEIPYSKHDVYIKGLPGTSKSLAG